MDFSFEHLRHIGIQYIILVGSIGLHEWGHAVMADRLGDDTPRRQGRVTLNPIAHIDPIGTVLIPLVNLFGLLGSFGLIGWGKPVQVNPSNFANRNADGAWVTIAGPAMNLLIGIAAVFAIAIANRFNSSLVGLFYDVLSLNVLLIVFNLLPIPPLDGSKFLMYWGGMSEELYWNIARFGFLVLLVLINIPGFEVVVNVLLHLAMRPFEALLSLLL